MDTDLAAVNTAITGILTGAQSTRQADGRIWTRADLETLRQMKNDLLAERDKLTGTSARTRDGSVLVGEI